MRVIEKGRSIDRHPRDPDVSQRKLANKRRALLPFVVAQVGRLLGAGTGTGGLTAPPKCRVRTNDLRGVGPCESLRKNEHRLLCHLVSLWHSREPGKIQWTLCPSSERRDARLRRWLGAENLKRRGDELRKVEAGAKLQDDTDHVAQPAGDFSVQIIFGEAGGCLGGANNFFLITSFDKYFPASISSGEADLSLPNEGVLARVVCTSALAYRSTRSRIGYARCTLVQQMGVDEA